MSILCWVHLSDIHYKDEYGSYIKTLMPSLINAIEKRDEIADDERLKTSSPLLFVTGDLSYSSSLKEFNNVLTIVISPIIENLGINIEETFICPGNHDLTRERSQYEIIQPYLKKNHKNVTAILDASNPQYKLLIKAFNNYQKFHKKLFPGRTLNDPSLFSVVNLENRPFSIITINTAWAGYGGDKDKGNLFIGLPQIANALESITSSNTIIILAHHPIHSSETVWFADSKDTDYSLRAISSRCSFIFSGHIHKAEAGTLVNRTKSLGISQGGALWSDEENHPSRPLSFSAGWIDYVNFKYRSHSFIYQPLENKWVAVGDTDEQEYKSESLSKNKISSVGIDKEKSIIFPEVREKDYIKLERKVSSLKNNISTIWVHGLPGFGKTAFSFELTNIFFNSEEPVYIKRGDENNLETISTQIRLRYPTKWFEYWKNYVKDSNNKLSDDELLLLIADIIANSPVWFLIESGEQFNKKDKPNLVKFINLVSSINCGLRLIVTTREIPEPISQPPNIIYKLDEFLLEDTKEFILSQVTCSEKFIEAIHDRFHGHPLSIFAFISQIFESELNEDSESKLMKDLSNVPIDTAILLESLWNNLSMTGKKIISTISEIPELGTPLVTSLCENNELEKSGLLSFYPSAAPNKEKYYVHPLITEVCIPTLNPSEILEGKIEAYHITYNNGDLCLGPDYVNALYEKGDYKKCAKLIESDGRAWIEVAGIEKSMHIINKYLLTKVDDIESLYLKGLCHLFSGDYINSSKIFSHLYSLNSGSEAFKLAIRAEVMECERRKGNIFGAFSELNELYPMWKNHNELINDKDYHYIGVCGFLIGHLFRSYGAYVRAFEVYSTAEEYFSKSDSLSNLIEKMHCQYARGLSQATANLIDDIDLIDSFSSKQFKSDFLIGLALYLKAACLIKENNIPNSLLMLEKARYHFQNFCSVAYDCRMIALSGIAEIYSGNLNNAITLFDEVLKISHNKSPQYLIAQSLSECIKGNAKMQSEKILEAFSMLLSQGKLATTATMLSSCYKILGTSSEIFAENIDMTVYLINTKGDQLRAESNILSSFKDLENMLMARLNASTVEEFYPIIE